MRAGQRGWTSAEKHCRLYIQTRYPIGSVPPVPRCGCGVAGIGAVLQGTLLCDCKSRRPAAMEGSWGLRPMSARLSARTAALSPKHTPFW